METSLLSPDHAQSWSLVYSTLLQSAYHLLALYEYHMHCFTVSQFRLHSWRTFYKMQKNSSANPNLLQMATKVDLKHYNSSVATCYNICIH